jgi:hypothetical protein
VNWGLNLKLECTICKPVRAVGPSLPDEKVQLYLSEVLRINYQVVDPWLSGSLVFAVAAVAAAGAAFWEPLWEHEHKTFSHSFASTRDSQTSLIEKDGQEKRRFRCFEICGNVSKFKLFVTWRT